MTISIAEFWKRFEADAGGVDPARFYEAFHFGDNEALADSLADLVLAGTKRATAGLLCSYAHDSKRLPRAGDLSVVTSWAGSPLCVIETVRIDVLPFDAVSAEFAAVEGEGDGSLDFWRREHASVFSRECARIGRIFDDSMLVVCERFRVVFRDSRNALGNPPYLLRTERLQFRTYRESDGDLLRPVFADHYAARFYPAMGTPEGIERWIDWNLRNYDAFGHGLWALELVGSGQFIGDAGITYQTVEGKRLLEIGWHIHPDHRTRGYATEAGKACLRLGFDVLQAKSLSSIVDPANMASIKVASRVHEHRRLFESKSGPMLLYSTRCAVSSEPT